MAAFFGEIAAAERQGKAVNYTLALRDGKRAVCHQTKWSDPYY